MPELAICAYCDTVHRRTPMRDRATARCVTCSGRLYRGEADIGAMLAVAITATVAFAIANWFPLVTLTSGGARTQATLWQAIAASYDNDLPLVALVLAVTLIVAPLLELGL
jgi:paraquat-inducible protein A